MKKFPYYFWMLISLGILEYSLYTAAKYNTINDSCGMEIIVFFMIVWPGFLLGNIIRWALRTKWEMADSVIFFPILGCIAASFSCFKSFIFTFICYFMMIAFALVDLAGAKQAKKQRPKL